MKKLLLFAATLTISAFSSFAQKGQVWPTLTRQEFEFNDQGDISKEWDATPYYSYYLFINNNEFVHCTKEITSLYKILKRDENTDYTDYTCISEAGNQYTFRFNTRTNLIAIYSTKGYGITSTCAPYYVTKVFENINR